MKGLAVHTHSQSVEQLWRDLEARLVRARAAVQLQIRQYPYPIPACDAQYNHLLEQRSAIGDAIVKAREERASVTDEDGALRAIRLIQRRVPSACLAPTCTGMAADAVGDDSTEEPR